MADNRMYVRCKECGQAIFLAKLFISVGWYTIDEDLDTRLNRFFDEHHIHSGFSQDAEPYEIAYENNDDMLEELKRQAEARRT